MTRWIPLFQATFVSLSQLRMLSQCSCLELSANPLPSGTNSSSPPCCRALGLSPTSLGSFTPLLFWGAQVWPCPGCCSSLQGVFLWSGMIRPGEDAPQMNAYLFLRAQLTTSLAGLMGTLEDPELAAGATNSPRGTGVITAREAERGVFISPYSCYSSLRVWEDPQMALSTNL